jgi:hypothetical protein
MRRIIVIAILFVASYQTAGLAQPLGPLTSRVDTYSGPGFGVITCVGTCYVDARRPQTRSWLCRGDWKAPICQLTCDGGQPVGRCE